MSSRKGSLPEERHGGKESVPLTLPKYEDQKQESKHVWKFQTIHSPALGLMALEYSPENDLPLAFLSLLLQSTRCSHFSLSLFL